MKEIVVGKVVANTIDPSRVHSLFSGFSPMYPITWDTWVLLWDLVSSSKAVPWLRIFPILNYLHLYSCMSVFLHVTVFRAASLSSFWFLTCHRVSGLALLLQSAHCSALTASQDVPQYVTCVTRLGVRAVVYFPKHKYPKIFKPEHRCYHRIAVGGSLMYSFLEIKLVLSVGKASYGNTT